LIDSTDIIANDVKSSVEERIFNMALLEGTIVHMLAFLVESTQKLI